MFHHSKIIKKYVELLTKSHALSDTVDLIYKRISIDVCITRGRFDHTCKHIDCCCFSSAITGNWERKRPVWAMLMVNGLTKGDIASRGFPVLDLYLAQMAAKLKKKVFDLFVSINSKVF